MSEAGDMMFQELNRTSETIMDTDNMLLSDRASQASSVSDSSSDVSHNPTASAKAKMAKKEKHIVSIKVTDGKLQIDTGGRTLKKAQLEAVRNAVLGNSSMAKQSEDGPSKEQELTEFITKYKKSVFNDVPVTTMRHIIPLLLMEVYSAQYGQYSRKVKGMWERKPADWPDSIPFVDPNNKMKANQLKPTKDQLVPMLIHLVNKYQRKLDSQSLASYKLTSDPLLSLASCAELHTQTQIQGTSTQQPTVGEPWLSIMESTEDEIDGGISTDQQNSDSTSFDLPVIMGRFNNLLPVTADEMEHVQSMPVTAVSQGQLVTSQLGFPVCVEEMPCLQTSSVAGQAGGMSMVLTSGQQTANTLNGIADHNVDLASGYLPRIPVCVNDDIVSSSSLVSDDGQTVQLDHQSVHYDSLLGIKQLKWSTQTRNELLNDSVVFDMSSRVVAITDVEMTPQQVQDTEEDMMEDWNPVEEIMRRIKLKIRFLDKSEKVARTHVNPLLTAQDVLKRTWQSSLASDTDAVDMIEKAHFLETVVDIVQHNGALSEHWRAKLHDNEVSTGQEEYSNENLQQLDAYIWRTQKTAEEETIYSTKDNDFREKNELVRELDLANPAADSSGVHQDDSNLALLNIEKRSVDGESCILAKKKKVPTATLR